MTTDRVHITAITHLYFIGYIWQYIKLDLYIAEVEKLDYYKFRNSALN